MAEGPVGARRRFGAETDAGGSEPPAHSVTHGIVQNCLCAPEAQGTSMSHHIARWLLALLALGLAGCSADEARVDLGWRRRTARIASADKEPHNWLTHGRISRRRVQPLAQITADNAPQLGLAWTYKVRTARGASATPIVLDGVMLAVTSSWVSCMPSMRRRARPSGSTIPRSIAPTAARPVRRRQPHGDLWGQVFVGALDGRCSRSTRRRAPSSGKH